MSNRLCMNCKPCNNQLEVITDCEDCEARIRVEAIEECAELFAETLSNMKPICGNNCPIKCEWGTDETCKNACKEWFIKKLEEKSDED